MSKTPPRLYRRGPVEATGRDPRPTPPPSARPLHGFTAVAPLKRTTSSRVARCAEPSTALPPWPR